MFVKHVVLLRFKEGTTEDQILDFFHRLESIPGSLSFEYGHYESKENLNKGFTHAFVMTFKDEKTRNAYLKEPLHLIVAHDIIEKIEDSEDKIIGSMKQDPKGVVAFDFLFSRPPSPRTVCDGIEKLLEEKQKVTQKEQECFLGRLKEAKENIPVRVIPAGFFDICSEEVIIDTGDARLRIDGLIQRLQCGSVFSPK